MNQIPTKVLAIGAATLVVVGLLLMLRSAFGWQEQSAAASVQGAAADELAASHGAESASAESTGGESSGAATAHQLVEAAATSQPVLAVGFDAAPAGLREAVAALEFADLRVVTTTTPAAVVFDANAQAGGQAAYTVTFAAATRFDTIDPVLAEDDLRAVWGGSPVTDTATTATATATAVTASAPFTRVVVLSDTLPLLVQALGAPSPAVAGVSDMAALVEAAWADRTTLALVPFDQLEPRLVVLAIDGQNPVDNRAHFNPARYPLAATVYAHLDPADADEAARIQRLLQALPSGNRDPEKLTVLAMTGVTAMCRMTASQMDRFGPAWPAEVVGSELASADLTHISNEVPFVEDCVPNTDPDNFNFCSRPEYVETLTASGADIIGMTGNHQNDFGRQNAMASLQMYDEWGLPYYGGGENLEEAYAPLIIEHNGNRLAFLGANSYGPEMAWATDTLPGAAPFDLNILSATIRSIKEKNLADTVFVELQYQESYDAQPLVDQQLDFNALARAGADVVTGVQSHVPQGIGFTDERLVLYGLGNLYFDQMWDQATREGMIVKHTIYNGRHISTQILTTLLYEYGQPRWTTPRERASMLGRVFGASNW